MELVGDLNGGRIPDKPAEIRCHEIQTSRIELMLSLALVAEHVYSFCIKAAASATAGERETSGRGGKSGNMDAIADSDGNGGYGDFKEAAAWEFRFTGGRGCSGRDEDSGRECECCDVRADGALDEESC